MQWPQRHQQLTSVMLPPQGGATRAAPHSPDHHLADVKTLPYCPGHALAVQSCHLRHPLEHVIPGWQAGVAHQSMPLCCSSF